MKIKYFSKPFYELNFIGNIWNFRIAKRQLALWKNYNPLFDFRF